MTTSFKQLIPGNPGTSFVVALLYALKKKYQLDIENEEQLSLFTSGIVHSRKVFFSGVISEIANRYGKEITFLSNSDFILRLARPEVDKKMIRMEKNILTSQDIDALIIKYEYIVFSVDMYAFKGYHDYHFVCISKKEDIYEVFEPKSGKVYEKNADQIASLLSSVTIGLKDILMCFVL